ncbi:MAG TPA: lysophospholipid acyltransferase family protein [Cellvibrionaceae bacterium]
MKHRLILIIIKLLGRLPLPVGRGVGALVGRIMARSGSRGRAARVTRVNIDLCFPELDAAERERLAQKSLIETGKVGAEMAAIWCRDEPCLRRHILGEQGAELISHKLAQGRGLIVLTPHLGNWEAISLYASRFGPITALYQPPKDAATDAFMISGRLKPNVKLAPTSRRGVTQLLKALRAGEMVGILPDQVPDEGSGQVAPFFNQPALTMTLVHGLIARTDCQVVMTFCERIAGGFKVVVRECDPGIRDENLDLALAALNRSVEDCVRLAPAQYQWEYKRFRTRCERDPYK